MDEIEDQIIDEDTFLEYILNTQDVENDSILYSATIANPDFLIEINKDTLTINPPENWFGSINVDVFATEFNQDPLLDSASFNLIVNSVDDLPFVFESINELNLIEDFNYNWILDLDDYFIDIDGELAYNYSLSDTNIIDVEIINDTLTISSLPDSNGTLEMILTATNPTRAIINDTIVITVDPINDFPYFANEMNNFVGLNLDFKITLNAFDIETENPTYSFLDNSSFPDWLIIDQDTLKGNPNILGSYIIPLSIEDGDTTLIDTLNINVENFKPVILDVYDVPGDFGGYVNLNFEASFFDTLENSDNFYTVFRNDNFMMGDPEWIAVDTILAISDSIYTAQVTTLADSIDQDSPGLTQFKLIANFLNNSYQSEPFTGYSIDNSYPNELSIIQFENNLFLSWSEFELDDLDYISIYRSESPGFLANEETFLSLSTTDTTFLDTTVNVLTDYYYKINATDLNGVTGSISDEIQGFVYINLPPSLSAIDSQYTIEDQSLEIILNATDPNEGKRLSRIFCL